MDNSALRMTYASQKQSKTHRIQKYFEELSDYPFTIEHSSCTKMFISDYLSRFSADDIETDSIPFLTNRKNLTGNLYMNNDISGACNNIADQPVSREDHSFPLTCSQTRAQNISLPGLFSAGGDAAKTRSKAPRSVTHQMPSNKPPTISANKSPGSSVL